MQREALIGLAVLLTLAVLGSPPPSKHAFTAPETQALTPLVQAPAAPSVRQQALMDTVTAVEDALERKLGPMTIQFVGSGDAREGRLTLQLDVAL